MQVRLWGHSHSNHHVINSQQLRICLSKCPIKREHITHKMSKSFCLLSLERMINRTFKFIQPSSCSTMNKKTNKHIFLHTWIYLFSQLLKSKFDTKNYFLLFKILLSIFLALFVNKNDVIKFNQLHSGSICDVHNLTQKGKKESATESLSSKIIESDSRVSQRPGGIS